MAYNKDILGWMTEHELQIIEKLAQRVPNEGLIVEVGSMFGRKYTFETKSTRIIV